ncbi:MAG: phosphate ABC transporter substrate-binding protein PstS [Acidobacteriota bacterium]
MKRERTHLLRRHVLSISLGLAFVIFGSGSLWAATDLLGAGATFPYPFYSKVFDIYSHHHDVRINYQAIGSGGGIKQLQSRTVDFGGTDAFMSEEELQASPAKVLHIPSCMGAVVVTYNLPGNPKLKMTSEIVAEIFLGKITNWSDPKIKALNPSASLPNLPMSVAHRSDGSGTTFIFSDYLTKVSSEWKSRVGRGKSLNWPVGVGAKGNAGVAGIVQQLPGSVGYVELIYAMENDMPFATLKNRSGNFITPSIDSVSLAANVELPADTRVSITDTDAAQGYPISSFTWLIFYQEQNYGGRSKDRAQATRDLLEYVIHDGQSAAAPLHYAPLPDAAVQKAEAILNSITYNGQSLQ